MTFSIEQRAHFIAASRGSSSVAELLRARGFDDAEAKRITDSIRTGLRRTSSLQRAAAALDVSPLVFLEPNADRARAIALGHLTLQPAVPAPAAEVSNVG